MSLHLLFTLNGLDLGFVQTNKTDKIMTAAFKVQLWTTGKGLYELLTITGARKVRGDETKICHECGVVGIVSAVH